MVHRPRRPAALAVTVAAVALLAGTTWPPANALAAASAASSPFSITVRGADGLDAVQCTVTLDAPVSGYETFHVRGQAHPASLLAATKMRTNDATCVIALQDATGRTVSSSSAESGPSTVLWVRDGGDATVQTYPHFFVCTFATVVMRNGTTSMTPDYCSAPQGQI